MHLLVAMPPTTANVGRGVPTTVGELVTCMARIAGRPDLVHVGARAAPADEPAEIVADVGVLAAWGWAPSLGLVDGLADVLAWWRETSAGA